MVYRGELANEQKERLWEVFDALGDRMDALYNPARYVEELRKLQVREEMARLIRMIADQNGEAARLVRGIVDQPA